MSDIWKPAEPPSLETIIMGLLRNLNRYASAATERGIIGHYKHTHSFCRCKIIHQFVLEIGRLNLYLCKVQAVRQVTQQYFMTNWVESKRISQNCSTKYNDARSFRRIFTAQHLLRRSQSQINISSHFFQQQEKGEWSWANGSNLSILTSSSWPVEFLLWTYCQKGQTKLCDDHGPARPSDLMELKDDEGGKCIKAQ